jgi:hypothetical protein
MRGIVSSPLRIVSALILLAGAAAQEAPKPQPAEQEDPGPPILKRGGGGARKPATTKVPPLARGAEIAPEEAAPATGSNPETGAATAPAAGGTADPRLDLIARARMAAADFTSELPNFICDQLTIRSTSSSKIPKWKVDDRVEVELLYVNGREDYRNPRINGKPLKKGSLEETGQWSRGDFGTTLADVMSSATNARFVKRGSDRAAGLDVTVYDMTVEQANSHWRIEYGAPIKPAYQGAIFVDPQTARLLRIEMQTRTLPNDYPLDTVEMTVEYGWVMIAGQKYLLPVESENLSCFRYSSNCSRNQIEFRNYRKFATESTISATDSTIDFGEAEPPKAEEGQGAAKPDPAKPSAAKPDPAKPSAAKPGRAKPGKP